MSSPETERFELTEEDYANEFNPNRFKFRQSKNQATYGMCLHVQNIKRYRFLVVSLDKVNVHPIGIAVILFTGIWADDSDEDERPSLSYDGKKSKGKNYTTPMSFVSGGVKVGDKVMYEVQYRYHDLS